MRSEMLALMKNKKISLFFLLLAASGSHSRAGPWPHHAIGEVRRTTARVKKREQARLGLSFDGKEGARAKKEEEIMKSDDVAALGKNRAEAFLASLFAFTRRSLFFFLELVFFLPFLFSPHRHGQGQGSPPRPLCRRPIEDVQEARAVGPQEEERRQVPGAPQKGGEGGGRRQGREMEKKGA